VSTDLIHNHGITMKFRWVALWRPSGVRTQLCVLML